MFSMSICPYCKEARGYMEELFDKYPEYRELDIEIIDKVENPDIADQYDYYHVPTYYLDGLKFHEEILSQETVSTS
ncbi:MAG: hypothetical protein WBI74_10400 [Caldicoprobacterales bacterium]|jgi:thioredoxin 1